MISDGRSFLYQYDTGRKIITSADYCEWVTKDGYDVRYRENGCIAIPDYLIDEAGTIKGYLRKSDHMGSYTIGSVDIPVLKRPKYKEEEK